MEFRILHGEDVRWISARGMGEDQGIVGRVMFGVFLDVFERKFAEEAREQGAPLSKASGLAASSWSSICRFCRAHLECRPKAVVTQHETAESHASGSLKAWSASYARLRLIASRRSKKRLADTRVSCVEVLERVLSRVLRRSVMWLRALPGSSHKRGFLV